MYTGLSSLIFCLLCTAQETTVTALEMPHTGLGIILSTPTCTAMFSENLPHALTNEPTFQLEEEPRKGNALAAVHLYLKIKSK